MKASEYKKHAQKNSNNQIIDLPLPSGAVFKVRRPPLDQFVVSGQAPASLTGKILAMTEASGVNEQTGAELLKRLTPDEILENMEFGCKLIVYACVEPKIVLEPIDDENALTPEEVLPQDFQFLLQWSMSGGSESVTLETFRKGRQ